ncbi:MAG: hypothetical protein HFG58_16185 [Lachnospiraceae bacterium]|nr:hypothetical protein [Lachnospiraceae bacterium]
MDGGLKVPPSFKEAFADARKKFERAYAKNVALKNTLGLINSTMDAVDLFACNHTWYSVMTCVEGKDYRSVTDESLQSLFVRMLALARIIKKSQLFLSLCLLCGSKEGAFRDRRGL